MFKVKKGFLVFLLVLTLCSSVSADEIDFKKEIFDNNEKIKELYESEDKLNSEIEILENRILNMAEEINLKQNIINDYTKTINEYEKKVKELNNIIGNLNNEISAIEQNISKNVDEINEFQDEVDKFKDVISKRLRNFYKHIDTYNPLIDIFYKSKNVFDFKDKIINMSKFIQVDRNIIEKVIKNIDDIKIKNRNIELQKRMIQDKMDLINENLIKNDENLNLLEEQRELKQREIDEINKIKDEVNREYENLSSEKKLIQDEIIRVHQDNYKLQEEIKKYLKKLNEDNKVVNSKVNYGKYLRPARGQITSKYGKRTHPITGKVSFHSGIDIAGNIGDKVIASLGGKVVSAGWYNSVYGNVVIINHGNNIQTFYAHLSKVTVDKGDIVSGGDIIGKIGTSGLSTGPHLHFEIRVNGEHVDPISRIKS